MKCPFCEREMIEGVMSGDGRSKVYWETPEAKLGVMDNCAINMDFGGTSNE